MSIKGHGQASQETSSTGQESKDCEIQDDNMNVISYGICVKSVLSQLSNPGVRADLINGKFGFTIESQDLEQLDEFRCLICPWWTGGHIRIPDSRHREAGKHLVALYRKSDNLMQLPGHDNCALSYRDWNETLEQLASSPYWYIVKADERCVHHDTKGQRTRSKLKVEPVTPPGVTPKRQKGLTRKIDEIVLISSDYDESEERSTQSEESSELELSPVRSNERRLNGATRKKVVTPPIFNMDGKTDLREFLCSYEKYFDVKYFGTDYDKTQQLGQFLDGKLLEVYGIKGGRKVKYSEMKRHLLSWYKKQGIGNRKYWRSEFEHARPGNDEPLDIYGLRLTELAELAYPHSTREATRYRQTSFSTTIDQSVAEKVLYTESLLNARSKKKQKLTFHELTDLAVRLSKDAKKNKLVVNWSKNEAPPERQVSFEEAD